ncbi:putative intracellular protease/amidase [Paenibacillus turicensis]|uniref:Intracellular protease/amidase n=1 Tax=Paenibacillus turicensis TaxID=160487 RepID=A0ABS4FLL8_9BACL|nr:DJ-1/PfpI family protein [Paenibacillus turicensis]MBP1903467.1 putative intracellular protease/amidase [Paenibacillus turicensis]
MDVNVLLFDDFETLDAFGPVEILGCVADYHLRYVSKSGGLISSKQGFKIETEKIASEDLSGILLIPGGSGTRTLVNDELFIEFLRKLVLNSQYCLTVCTGSALLAKTGLLDTKKATSNKKAFAWVKSVNNDVKWVEKARWVVDGNYYTSSGVSAGMDMVLGFIRDQLGVKTAMQISDYIEYIWNDDPDFDPFANTLH